MANYHYRGDEIAQINGSFMQVMYYDYEQLKHGLNPPIPDNKEVNWCFFHRTQLERFLSAENCIGLGFAYIANSPSILYPTDGVHTTDPITGTITVKGGTGTDHYQIETIIAMMGVAQDATPIFIPPTKGTNLLVKGSTQNIAIVSLEPCPKVCSPAITQPEPTALMRNRWVNCFKTYYTPLKNNNIYPTDAGAELDQTLFTQQYNTYLSTRANYQKFESAYFSSLAIRELLKTPNCIGIRCGIMLYYNSYRCMFIVGVNDDADRSWQWDNIILFSNLELNL